MFPLKYQRNKHSRVIGIGGDGSDRNYSYGSMRMPSYLLQILNDKKNESVTLYRAFRHMWE